MKPADSALPLRTFTCTLLGAVLLAACASSKDPSRKPAELTDIKPAVELRTRWSVAVGAARGAALQPAVAENAIYAAGGDGALVRIAPESGQIVWRVDTETPISAGVGSDGLTVAVGTPRGEVLAYDVDGKLRWRAQVSSDVTAPPLVGRGTVIVRSTDHRVTAFESDSGKRRWTYQRQQPPLSLRTGTEMAFAGDTVVVGFPGGRLVGVALANGAARWEVAVSEPKGTTEVERLADVVGAVAVAGREVCAASFQGRIVCADAVNGNLRWARELSAGAGVEIGESQVYGVDVRASVFAFTRDAGASVWKNDMLANRALTTPAEYRRAVAVGDLGGYVHLLSATDGAFVGRARVDSSAIVARPQRWADGLVVQTLDGTVALLEAVRQGSAARP
jgi:outer membrane protein assembly factor BamB